MVPTGCSYSAASKMAVFNSNPNGRSHRGHMYPLVCLRPRQEPKSSPAPHIATVKEPTAAEQEQPTTIWAHTETTVKQPTAASASVERANVANDGTPTKTRKAKRTLDAKITVHGDPMLKKDGVGVHFQMPRGRPVELLTWAGKAGELVMLTGTAFEREETGHHWFNSFAMSVDGHEVFNCSLGKVVRGTMRVLIDGKNVTSEADVSTHTSAVHKGTTLELSVLMGKKFMIGNKRAQQLKVHTGDMSFTVYSSKADKFDSKTAQFKFRHLNVRLDSGIPAGARGIFAEISGAAPLSSATQKLIDRPKQYNQLVRRESRLSGKAMAPLLGKAGEAKKQVQAKQQAPAERSQDKEQKEQAIQKKKQAVREGHVGTAMVQLPDTAKPHGKAERSHKKHAVQKRERRVGKSTLLGQMRIQATREGRSRKGKGARRGTALYADDPSEE
jgi:hypothetical protein